MSMTKGDRGELQKLANKREKVAKAQVDQVAAARLAEFEQQAASYYRVHDDEVWAEQHRVAQEAIADANARVRERCRELGVPEWTSPSISTVGWHERGENAAKGRVAELRRVAKTRLDADAKAAKVEIEQKTVDVHTQLLSSTLETDEARAFLAQIPTPEQLLPAPTVAEIEKASESYEGDDRTYRYEPRPWRLPVGEED
jgi:hypothetical protein